MRILLLAALIGCNGSSDIDTQPDETGDTDVDTGDTGTDIPWDPEYDELAAAIDAERQELGAPGVAFLIWQGDEVLFSAGFGDRHPETGEPVEPDTLFRIGSITKMMTAAAVLREVEQGNVALTDPLSTPIADLEFALGETWADDIQVGHLLTHQGGFYDYTEIDGDVSDAYLDTWLTGWFATNLFLMNPPGLFWNYANPNYMFAGLVVQRSSGQDYTAYLDEHVFTPLGMDRTLFFGEDVLADGNYASGATVDWNTGTGEVVAEPDSYDHGASRPAGFAWSSTEDLMRFGQFLMHGGDVLDDVSPMAAEQVPIGQLADVDHYGYGVMSYRGFNTAEGWHDERLWTHGGAISGFAADLYMLPDKDYGIAVLSNTDGAYYTNSVSMALEMAEPATGTRPELTPDPETFGDFVGHYDDPWNVGPMDVDLVDGTLTIDMPLLDDNSIPYDTELVPYTPDNFLIGVQGFDFVLTFIRDEAGEVDWARTRYFVLESQPVSSVAPVERSFDAGRFTKGLREAARQEAADAARRGLVLGR